MKRLRKWLKHRKLKKLIYFGPVTKEEEKIAKDLANHLDVESPGWDNK